MIRIILSGLVLGFGFMRLNPFVLLAGCIMLCKSIERDERKD